MTEREKIIEGLERRQRFKTPDGSSCVIPANLLQDALALLKAQEPRVMTPTDVNNIGPEDVCAFIEIREETHMYACYMRQYDETHTEILCDVPDMPTKLQNGCARLWTSRPDEKRRAETPWE